MVMGLDSYSSACDIITIVVCIMCWLFLKSTYSTKHKNLLLFYAVNSMIVVASISSIIYHTILDYFLEGNIVALVTAQNTHYGSLALIFVAYCVYLSNLFEMTEKSKNILYALTVPAFFIFTAYKLISPFFWKDLYDTNSVLLRDEYYMNVFVFYYLYFSILLVSMIIIFRKRLLTKVRKCLCSVIALSFIVILLQYIFKSTTFTCVSFTLPVVTALFFFHYNAYDIKTGTLDFKSYGNYINDLKDKPFGIFCLYLKDFSIDNNSDLANKFMHYTENLFNDYCMFRMADEIIMLVYKKHTDSSDEQLIKNVMTKFNEVYNEFRIPFKLLHIQSNHKLKGGDDYIDLSAMLVKKMELNTFYKCQETDVDNFIKMSLIKDVLFDIYVTNNLDDPRVKVYCQPILDVQTNQYKNAEILMRIKSNDIVFTPDVFIPIAESNGYIHILSKIILNKTCKYINELIEEGYSFDRMSINFSTIDFKERDFYQEVLDIIELNNTPADKIAIEITESKDENEYRTINRAIKKLKDKGIVFYLDDFGTGYSNFQRTFTLPVDIIKFDKSLTSLACKNPETYGMVKRFSYMLSTFGYKILFEGIETPEEEMRCKEMTVSYLQGYNYSEPVEVDNIKNYFSKTN